MKIAVFGGSFNPVHKGHLLLVEHAFKVLSLDHLFFLPCYCSVDKNEKDYLDSELRLDFLRIVLPKKCSISSYEICQGEPVQTCKSIDYFRCRYPQEELFFLLGDDLLPNLHTWERIDEMVDQVKFVVFKREGDDTRSKDLKEKLVFLDNPILSFSSTQYREGKVETLPSILMNYMRKLQS